MTGEEVKRITNLERIPAINLSLNEVLDIALLRASTTNSFEFVPTTLLHRLIGIMVYELARRSGPK